MTGTQLHVPQQPWITQLFYHAEKTPNRTFIRDLGTGKEATFNEFLYEVLTHGARLKERLSQDTQARLHDPNEEVFIGLLAKAGVEYVVLLFAIYSIGGIAVPMRTHVHPEEARYFLGACNAVALTSSQEAAEHGESLSAMLGIDLFTFSPSPATEYANAQFTLMHEPNSDPSKPPFNPARCFALLYTSGTTGPPKGALYTCNSLVLGTKSYLDRLSLSTTDTWLHQMPAHWKGGFDFILAAAYAGACLEFCSVVFSPTWFWERMRRGGITAMVASPATLSGLKEQLDLIESREEREECIRGLNEIRALSTGSMAVPDSVKDIWRKLRGGRPLVIMYGFTEAAGMMAMTDWRDIETRESSSGNCGTLAPGMEAKVNECGEICFKGPLLMKRYVSAQENVMSNVFDESGFYKSGDLGSISANGEVSIHGRANQDVIRSLGWKINALEVEDALRDHPSISNVFILGVADTEAGQRVAALIVRKRAVGTKSQNDFRLVALRKYLAVEKQLPAFKLPTLLRVIPHGQTLPTSDSGKPSKKKMEGVYFGGESVESGEVEVWDFKTKEDFPERPWDWEGRPPA